MNTMETLDGMISVEQKSGAYQKSKDSLFISESSGHFSDKVHLVFRIVSASNQNVLQCSLSINAKPFGDSLDSFMTKCSFSVNVCGLRMNEWMVPGE
jgi:hypothetical protein